VRAEERASIVGKFELLKLPRVEILARDDVEFAWVAGWERPALQLGVAVVHHLEARADDRLAVEAGVEAPVAAERAYEVVVDPGGTGVRRGVGEVWNGEKCVEEG
jgi:hypothetical protein